MCSLLTLTQRPLFGQLLVVPNILPSQVYLSYLLPHHAFAGTLTEPALASTGRELEAIAGSLDRRGDKS